MKTVEELLKSKGREVMTKTTVDYLTKRGELISPIVAACHGEARAALGPEASADALARRTALLVLKRIAHISAKPAKVAPAEPVAEAVAEPENPGHFTQPAE